MGPKKPLPEIGKLFGKPDWDRCGLYADMGFTDWGSYTGKEIILNEASKKGNQMLSGVPSGGHKKCGVNIQSGYFEKKFFSISVNDPYVEKWKTTKRAPAHPRFGPWIPARPTEKHSTPGDNFGTFTKKSEYKAFSPLTKPLPPKGKEPINFLTNPGKKGGPGYQDIGINKYPPHSVRGKVDKYNDARELYSQKWKAHKKLIRDGPLTAGFYPRNFDETPYKCLDVGPTYVRPTEKVYGESRGIFYPPAKPKPPGNNHDGCFNKFPEWSAEPYKTPKEVAKALEKSSKHTGVWVPQPGFKSYYRVSIVNNKIDTACNENTWRTMKPITYPQFNL